MKVALKYLLNSEYAGKWCPACAGCSPVYYEPESPGHYPNCPLAAAIKDVGGHPLYRGDYESVV